MNLTEATDREIKHVLDSIDPNNPKDYLKIRNYLKKNGFKEVGRGSFSDVYSKPDYKRLIKLKWKRQYKAKEMHNYEYYDYCKKMKNRNPYLPKVYYLEGSALYYVAVIEKLEKIDRNNLLKDMSEEEILIIYHFFTEKHWGRRQVYEEAVRRILGRPYEAPFPLDSGYKADPDIEDAVFEYIYFEDLDKHKLFKLLEYLRENIDKVLDLGINNIMKRKRNNQVVVMDPLYG